MVVLENGLTPKQETFAQKYVELGNASEAYRTAYPSSRKWKENTVWSASSRLLADSKVSARVKEIQEEVRKNAAISKDEIVRLCVEVLRGKQIPDSIDEVKVGNITKRKVRGVSKTWAAERLAKMLGYDEPTELNIRKSDDKKMTPEEMQAEIDRLRMADDA